MQIIVVRSVEATKHDDCVGTYLDTREPSPGLRLRVSHIDLFPAHFLQVKAVQIIDIVLISTADDEQKAFVNADACVTPSC